MQLTEAQIQRAMKDAAKLLSGTYEIMRRLVHILKTENQIAPLRKMADHALLLKEKQREAMNYRANMKSIAAHPDILKSASQEVREAMRDMAQQLARAVDENARILRATAEASRQLIQNVVAMVRNEVMPRRSYKNSARSHLELGNYSPTCRPVAIIRTV